MLRSIGGAHMPQEKPPETFSASGGFFACLYHEHNRPALLDVSVLGGVEAGCSYILPTDRMNCLHGDFAA